MSFGRPTATQWSTRRKIPAGLKTTSRRQADSALRASAAPIFQLPGMDACAVWQTNEPGTSKGRRVSWRWNTSHTNLGLLSTKRLAQSLDAPMHLYPVAAVIRPRSGGKPLILQPFRPENRLLEIKVCRRVAACGRTQVPIKISPKALRENETAVEQLKQGLVEVQLQLHKIFPSGPESLPSEGRQLPRPGLSLGQHYVHAGEGRPLPPKDANVNSQQEPRVSAALEEPLRMVEIPRLESVLSAIPNSHPERLLPEERQLSPTDLSTVRRIVLPGKGKLMLSSSPPGLAHPLAEKEAQSPKKEPPSLPSRLFVLPGGDELMPLNSFSGQLYLPTH